MGVTVVNARFAKPFDEALLLELERDHSHVITLEEHSLAGGFGSAVAEFVSDRGLNFRVERIGVPNVLFHTTRKINSGRSSASTAKRWPRG